MYESRKTPLLNPLECLENHTQYICGTCGRCICIEKDPNRELQRWNFPFKTLEIAKLYLRTADYTNKKSCGIYEIESEKGRKSYKIFADNEELAVYLKKNKGKRCKKMAPEFAVYEREIKIGEHRKWQMRNKVEYLTGLVSVENFSQQKKVVISVGRSSSIT